MVKTKAQKYFELVERCAKPRVNILGGYQVLDDLADEVGKSVAEQHLLRKVAGKMLKFTGKVVEGASYGGAIRWQQTHDLVETAMSAAICGAAYGGLEIFQDFIYGIMEVAAYSGWSEHRESKFQNPHFDVEYQQRLARKEIRADVLVYTRSPDWGKTLGEEFAKSYLNNVCKGFILIGLGQPHIAMPVAVLGTVTHNLTHITNRFWSGWKTMNEVHGRLR